MKVKDLLNELEKNIFQEEIYQDEIDLIEPLLRKLEMYNFYDFEESEKIKLKVYTLRDCFNVFKKERSKHNQAVMNKNYTSLKYILERHQDILNTDI